MGNNNPATTTMDFVSCLRVEHDAVAAFVTLLETEQQALINGNADQLLALADSKIQAAHKLSKLANARRDGLLARVGKVEFGDMTAWLQANAANSLPIWNGILQLAEQAQQLNSTNGILIQTKLRQNQQALMALNNATHSTNGLYGPDGQTSLLASGRTLGSV